MRTFIPDDQVRFAQLAVQHRFVSPEQVRSALDLYRRYIAVNHDVPSLARILVSKRWMAHEHAEKLYRHLLNGEPLPQMQAQSVATPVRDPDDARLQIPQVNTLIPQDDPRAIMEGLGATALPKDLQEIKGYKIESVIGEGATGIVYKAKQLSMDRIVALKVLPARMAANRRYIEEFLAEARNAGRLNHPNLVRVHEVGTSGETYYYSMEYVEGQRLDELWDDFDDGCMDPKQCVQIFIQIASALDYGFKNKVIHREIRPNTIMISPDGNAKLADLGLTRDEQTRFLEGENSYYVAPEQINAVADTRSDIYSLGCCMYHALTGEFPFGGASPKEILAKRVSAPTPNPRAVNPRMPRELSEAVMKMMARNPNDRYQSPGQLVDALKKMSIPSAPPVTRPARPTPRRRR